MLQTLETMAAKALNVYLLPLIYNGKVISEGFPPAIAAKKAAAANRNLTPEIYKIADRMQKQLDVV